MEGSGCAATRNPIEDGADGEIRTLTDEDLNLVPLPLGYVGDPTQDTETSGLASDPPDGPVTQGFLSRS